MRYLLRTALGGALAIAADPATAAVFLTSEPAFAVDLTSGKGSAGGELLDDGGHHPITAMPPAAHDRTRSSMVQHHAGTDVAELPEPATWAMMFLGFGGLSFALRRRRPPAARIRFS